MPYGYRKPPGQETNRAAVPIQDETICAHVVHIKDMLLGGQSIRQVAAYLEAMGLPTPGGGKRWYANSVRNILRNPFYAGVVRFGVTQAKLDPRTGRRYRDRRPARSRLVSAQGQHQPLWDIPTHQAILKELKQRGTNYRGRKNNQFTSLLSCGVCGARLWTFYDGHYGRDPVRVWRCSTRQAHVVIKHQEMLDLFAARLSSDLDKLIHSDAPQPVRDTGELPELLSQRARLEDAYQAGMFSLDSFSERVADLDERIHQLENLTLSAGLEMREQKARLDALQELAGEIDYIPHYLSGGDPQEINHLLRMLMEQITVNIDHTLEVEYKA